VFSLLLAVVILCGTFLSRTECVQAATSGTIPFILLSCYRRSIPIDGEFMLVAITSNGKQPRFTSSKSSIASVNTYGIVTGNKSGTCKITAKISQAEASCVVTVEKSKVTINKSSITLENGESIQLSATVSTGHDVTWKSASSAIASVDEDGIVTAKKCGSTTIRATADGVSAKCQLTVKKPSLSLNRSNVILYPDEGFSIIATCSSNRPLTYRSSSSAVASVDERGHVWAKKPGSATITVKVDGVSKTCKVTVKSRETDAES
jgi:uncharacterized protein YjdB